MERPAFDRLLRELYVARVRGDLDAVCGSFLNDARFEIAGASRGSPTVVTSVGLDQFRLLLALMIKTFKISEQSILSIIIDGEKAAVHWRATVHSRITGATVATELVDLVEVRDDLISSYIEFFVPRQP